MAKEESKTNCPAGVHRKAQRAHDKTISKIDKNREGFWQSSRIVRCAGLLSWKAFNERFNYVN
jgi:hypothetical protein